MSVLGIVAEYDPFHNGHLRHLRSAMDAVSPSAVLAAVSGPFKQRGGLALLSPFARAECALASGVDAVFALLVILGIVVDPTTAGVGDSRRAMRYEEPYRDNPEN